MTTVAGDATLDGSVGQPDLSIVLSNFGKPGVYTWSQGDFNYDGVVGQPDLSVCLSNFGKQLPGLTVNVTDYPNLNAAAIGMLEGAGINVVPEPSTLILLAVMAAAAGLWRIVRRRRNSDV